MHKDKKSDPYMSNSAKWPSKRISHGMLFLSHLPLCHLLFFIIGICGMILMFIFGAKLDKTDVKSNWIEQCTNLVAQLCFLLGIILV